MYCLIVALPLYAAMASSRVRRWDGAAWNAVPNPVGMQVSDLSPLGYDTAWALGTDANGAPVAAYYGVLPTFSDVPATDTFYPYIEWMACRGIIGGYPCSGADCDDYNRPVFRPGNGVSRGQVLKMVSLTAGWSLLNPATPTFADGFLPRRQAESVQQDRALSAPDRQRQVELLDTAEP